MTLMVAAALWAACAAAMRAAINRFPPLAPAPRGAGTSIIVAALGTAFCLDARSHMPLNAFRDGVLIATVSAAARSDLACGHILDVMTFPAALALLAAAVSVRRWEDAVLGAIACAAPLLLLWGASRTRGLGLGDVKLGACIGLALGAAGGLLALGFAFALGGAHGAVLLCNSRARRGDAICFGPFLAFGAFCALAAGGEGL